MEQISNSEYRSREGISSSDVKGWVDAVSPKHWKHKQSENTDNDKFRIGRVFHSLVLENIEPIIFQEPINEKTGKAYGYETKKYLEAKKNFEELNATEYITSTERAKMEPMREALIKEFGQYLTCRGFNERSFFAQCPDTGMKVKCRPDRIAGATIFDLKTCDDIGRFEIDVKKWGYHIQAAFYSDVFELATGKKPDKFIFMAVEKREPFDTCLYELSAEYFEIGRIKYKKAMKEMKACQESGNFPGVMGDKPVLTIDAPYWLWKQEMGEV